MDPRIPLAAALLPIHAYLIGDPGVEGSGLMGCKASGSTRCSLWWRISSHLFGFRRWSVLLREDLNRGFGAGFWFYSPPCHVVDMVALHQGTGAPTHTLETFVKSYPSCQSHGKEGALMIIHRIYGNVIIILFPIVEPDPGHTKLRLSREGLEAIKRISNPIAAVAVIGPYRSGKSFLLNQLLSLSCDEGFGVGHMRDTKTKGGRISLDVYNFSLDVCLYLLSIITGIWVWGTPIELNIDGIKTSVFYLDTEGFESVGKSNVYDDRIFALATVMSSVLIYNLPETIFLLGLGVVGSGMAILACPDYTNATLSLIGGLEQLIKE
ncbi:Guanylate-binding protein, N-terminal [Dillenia turbinata]|uniref:Guanylate-binding protein, N-terminal n=1 Tax=Dillenia turbinata TaxID=194707 RepID=A0AAN8ZK19_9MAGN